MRFGLHLPSAQPAATADGIMSVARAAERLDFDSVWMFDHLFTPAGLDSKYPYSRDGSYPMSPDDPFYDPLGLFGVLAGATERVRMGTGVLIPTYRHPIVLGKIIATIERFAPERIVLGVGAGWMKEEFEAVGVGYERRGARFEEYISALRAVWSGRSSFDGEFYSWPDAGFHPTPTAPIPIVLGGHGDKTLERVARFGDGWAVVTGRGQGSGLDAIAARLDLLRAECDKVGRDFKELQLLYQTPLWFSDQPHPKMPMTGPPDAMAESVKRLEELGITTMDLLVFGPAELVIETAERFASEVLQVL
jgi:probable F420-dependent oxidoreductase